MRMAVLVRTRHVTPPVGAGHPVLHLSAGRTQDYLYHQQAVYEGMPGALQ